jgi:hypothetical protein
MKILMALVATLLVGSAAMAEEAQKQTILVMTSFEGDWVGSGKSYVLVGGKDGRFSIRDENDSIQVGFNGLDGREHWNLAFTPQSGKLLDRCVYQNVSQFSINQEGPTLDVKSRHKSCGGIVGEFEILELEYGDEGEIEAFAANFIQTCSTSDAPLFGTIRYNSAISLEARFQEIVENKSKPQFIVTIDQFSSERNPYPVSVADFVGHFSTPAPTSQRMIDSEKKNTIMLQKLPYDDEGVRIVVDTYEGLWTLDFAAPSGDDFEKNSYGNAERYPFHSRTRPGIKIVMPTQELPIYWGEFQVLEIDTMVGEEEREIKALALNFEVESSIGNIKGIIRYNSSIHPSAF